MHAEYKSHPAAASLTSQTSDFQTSETEEVKCTAKNTAVSQSAFNMLLLLHIPVLSKF